MKGSYANYSADFKTTKDQWMNIEIPVENFKPYYFGRSIRAPKLKVHKVNSMGILISDKQEGDFLLKINDYELCDLRFIHKIIFSSSSFFLSSIGIYAISFFIALMASLYFSGSAKSFLIKFFSGKVFLQIYNSYFYFFNAILFWR